MMVKMNDDDCRAESLKNIPFLSKKSTPLGNSQEATVAIVTETVTATASSTAVSLSIQSSDTSNYNNNVTVVTEDCHRDRTSVTETTIIAEPEPPSGRPPISAKKHKKKIVAVNDDNNSSSSSSSVGAFVGDVDVDASTSDQKIDNNNNSISWQQKVQQGLYGTTADMPMNHQSIKKLEYSTCTAPPTYAPPPPPQKRKNMNPFSEENQQISSRQMYTNTARTATINPFDDYNSINNNRQSVVRGNNYSNMYQSNSHNSNGSATYQAPIGKQISPLLAAALQEKVRAVTSSNEPVAEAVSKGTTMCRVICSALMYSYYCSLI